MSPEVPHPSDLAALTAYNKEQATKGHSDLLVKKDFTAIDKYFANPYIQHNQALANGVESLREFKMANVPGAETTILRCFADKDMVFFQEKVQALMPQALDFWDLYRLEEGKIVEHWDTYQISSGAHPATGHTLFDGPTESSSPELTEVTRAFILKLVNNVFVCRKTEELGLYVSPNVIQHAPGVEDGVESWMKHLKVSQWFTGDIQYDVVRRLVVEGNFAVSCSQGTVGNEPHHFWDMWRVENGKVAEHWNATKKTEKGRLNRNPVI
jgi:predicted SnoaL-like aldol condensation-catalyzing enzyme